MQYCSRTDIGKIREHNEDFCMTGKIQDFTVLILADGMGGHNGGETASKMAAEMIFAYLESKLAKNMLPGQIMLTLSEAIAGANNMILGLSQKDPVLGGMGTTVDICVCSHSSVYIAHIGDSRVYKITAAFHIQQLTKDHSLVEYMVETGAITREEAAFHPQKNIITRALGISPETDADVFRITLEDGDKLLMCSDGLTNMLTNELIVQTVKNASSLEAATEKLVLLANEEGGNDNITVILAE